jgi:hypothetical protein
MLAFVRMDELMVLLVVVIAALTGASLLIIRQLGHLKNKPPD